MSTPLLVTGLPRSGTTIVAHVLSTHPDIDIYTSGAEARVLECDELRPDRCTVEDLRAVRDDVLAKSAAQYTVLKRPWLVAENACIALRVECYGAPIICVNRDAVATIDSWIASPLCAELNRRSRYELGKLYAQAKARWFRACREKLFPGDVWNVRYEEMLRRCEEVFADIADWLEIADDFDYKAIWKPGERRAPVGAPAPVSEWQKESA